MVAPPSPVDAATVVLARPGEPAGTGWQCYMVRRPVKSEFAADVFVFPGGKVDPGDRDSALTDFIVEHPDKNDTDEDEWLQWRAVRLAAIRELFEEVGVLLAGGPDGSGVRLDGTSRARFTQYRCDLQEGELNLLGLARAENLLYRLDTLWPISRWITPEVLPRRFDTWFFVAVMPMDQQPAHDNRETTAGVWIAPGEALTSFYRGEFPLVWATEKHLERLARYATVEDLVSATTAADLLPVTPKIVQSGESRVFLLPGDPGY